MNISVVIPLLNEEESIKELYLWIAKVMQANSFSYEVIFIDDGSTDTSWSIIDSLHKQDPQVKAIQFLRNFGKSQALHAGFAMAQGDVVITMDADLQDNPEEIPELYNMVCKQGYDLVSGWKKVRYDSKIFKNFPSKIFNWAARKTSGVQLNDFNCGLKAYHKNVIKNIEVTGEMHRYIPVLASNAGFTKIGEKIVQHQARKYGSTKFGVDRFTHGFLDLLTLWFFSRFGRRPMHLFGALGAFMLTIGFLFAFYLGVDKLFINTTGRLITERPQFYIAITAMIIGSQFFLAGFLGELLLRTKKENSNYSIKNTL
ncbi:glycosyltransferase [Flavobacteriaceae bacterium]|nr:glycosyltransferase [Flavobacteriaceae bacterium]MDA9247256.1 glycosyltransferase [Flavobacteriaceae bacterium]MDA9283757.1 glycosyltransferase [Flavobacteriaceae bacterium]MDA9780752.1 glycosyltransferase [Flavobacteriaceae bacterium]